MLLAALLLCLSSCTRSPHEQEAAAEVRTIAEAVQSFRLEYGHNPVVTNAEPSRAMETVLPVLMAMSNSANAAELNPKGIRFLDVPTHRIQAGEYVDPWGRPYHIAVAKNGNQTTEVGGTIVKAKVAVWSSGRNGKDEGGSGDDICSWERGN